MAFNGISIDVIMAVYNRADFTRLVLDGFLLQTDMAFKIILADDGSGPEIRELVKEYQEKGLEITHLWHEDKGFRKTIIVNKAIELSIADYLIFIDNDCIPQYEFIADHRWRAYTGHFVVGRRVNLDENLTKKLLLGHSLISVVNNRGWLILNGLKKKLRYPEMGLRIPKYLSWILSRKPMRLLGANFAGWREDVLAINGYDSDFVGYGMEDVDIEWRLIASGLKARSLKARGCVVHLYHEERQGTQTNRDIIKERMKLGMFRVKNGVVPSTP